MLCDICKTNKAAIHIKQIFNEEKIEVHLCEECANLKEILSNFKDFGASFFKLLPGLSSLKNKEEKKETGLIHLSTTEKLICPNCNLQIEELKKTGKFGCSRCYDTFSKEIKPLFRKLHGFSVHVGKVPENIKEKIKKKEKLKRLNLRLKEAIQLENYEDAAKIRDMINQLSDTK